MTQPPSSPNLDFGRIGFGGAPIGGFRFALSDDEGAAVVRAAAEAGVRYFDTSPYYGYGRSELLFGAGLRSVPRDSFLLSTKVGRVMAPIRPGESVEGWRRGGLPFRATFDYSRDGTLRSLEQSHLRLGLASIDIALIHDCDVFTHGDPEPSYRQALAGAWPALAELKRQGVIRATGVGLNEVEASLRFLRDTDIDLIMLAGRYTLLDQSGLDELLPLAQAKGVGILLAAPFNSGILATGSGSPASYDYAAAKPDIVERVRQIETVCARHGVALQAAALQFPLAHPAMRAVVPGATRPAEVRQNVAWMNAPIPAGFWQELRSLRLIRPEAPVPG